MPGDWNQTYELYRKDVLSVPREFKNGLPVTKHYSYQIAETVCGISTQTLRTDYCLLFNVRGTLAIQVGIAAIYHNDLTCRMT